MFDNIKKGWAVGSATRKLVFQDKDLLYYPLLGMVVALVEFLVIFLVPLVLFKGSDLLSLVELVVFYVITFFTSTYVLMAMYLAFRSFIAGKRIGMGEAFNQVAPYWLLILEWAVFSTIILMIVRVIESRLGFISRILFGSLMSLGIAIATYFAVPVMLDKKLGPIGTVEESAKFTIQNFGTTFGGFAYSELYSLMLTIAGIVILIFGFVLGLAVGQPILSILSIAAGFLLIVFSVLLNYTLINVFKLIIYEHANGKPLPNGFDDAMISSAMNRKPGKGGGAAAQPAPLLRSP